MRQSGWPWLLGVIILLASACIVLVCVFAQPDDLPSRGNASIAPHSEPSATTATAPAPTPRRIPVAGANGFYVVINLDGSSYMVAPDGKRTQLADAAPQTISVDAATDKVMSRMVAPPKRIEIGKLVVCDKGVVDVPKDAIITFVGSDKVVTHNPDGSSTVYFIDGKVMRRDRTERRSEGRATLQEP